MEMFLTYYTKSTPRKSILKKLAQLCSNSDVFLFQPKSNIVLIAYKPDYYVQNQKEINVLTLKFNMKQLMMNNFKFLDLLTHIDNFNLSVAQILTSDTEITDDANILFFLDEDEKVAEIQALLENNNLKIQGLEMNANNDLFKINSNGLVAMTRGTNVMDEIFNEIIKVISFLFKGKIYG